MDSTGIVGIDISKRVFQLHGATAAGSPVFRKKLSRGQFLPFLAKLPPCLVVMEACGGAHHWGRRIIELGHDCRLVPPVYVKPQLKRQKSDANDSAAIVEAAQRPTMRFVAVKSEEAQADAALFRTRTLLVRQRTQAINSLRGQLAEFGVVAARGVANAAGLEVGPAKAGETIPEQVEWTAGLLLDLIDGLSERTAELDREIRARAREREDMRRLTTIPGVGPAPRFAAQICAMAVHAFAPPMEGLRRPGRPDAPAALDGRAAEAGEDHQDGAARHPEPARSGGDDGAAAPAEPRRGGRPLAPQDGRGEAAEGCRGGAGKQDGARRLGAFGPERHVAGAGGSGELTAWKRERRRDAGSGAGTPAGA